MDNEKSFNIEDDDSFAYIYESQQKNRETIDYELIETLMKTSFFDFYASSYVSSPVARFFDSEPNRKNMLISSLYKLLYGKVVDYDWFKDTGFVNRIRGVGDVKFSMIDTVILGRLIYLNKDFPFGYFPVEYARHKRIMDKRYYDVKERRLIPPNFKSSDSYGLKEMIEYVSDKRNRLDKARPKVKGKTLLLTAYEPNCWSTVFDEITQTEKYDSFDREFITRITFLNKLDNVEHPLSYFINYNYCDNKDDGKRAIYNWKSLNEFLETLVNYSGHAGLNESLSKQDIICFNVFEFPLKPVVIETFMSFMIPFSKKHPNIYIKDISGRGYSAYKNYAFYDELLKSTIDIG